MRFYPRQHKYYCGIDLHARKIYAGIIDQQGKLTFDLARIFLQAGKLERRQEIF